MKPSLPVIATFLLCSIAAGSPAFAQSNPGQSASAASPAPVEAIPEDALNRGTPRGSAVGFLDACANGDFERASQYLDLRNLPEDVASIPGKELARELNHVLSRAVWLDDYSVSDRPEGAKGDGLPEYRDLLVTVKTPKGEAYPIWMQRVPRSDGEKIWKLSNRSVALIPELYAEYSFPPVIERIRTWFPEQGAFLGIEAFKWFILFVIGLLSWPVLWVVGWLLSRLFSSPQSDLYPSVRKFFTGPMLVIGILVVLALSLAKLGAGAYAQDIMNRRTLTTIVVVWALWSLVDLYRAHKQARLEAAGRPGAARLMRPMTGLAKLILLIFGALFWLNNMGVNITTVLAGLGVGGLAVALALQKPIEDMMGALTIFSQSPMRVGDFVRYGSVTGMVEDIGLRTTRVRTLQNTVVSIPNARIAHDEVENLSYRTKIRYWPTLRLRYDISREQLRTVRDGIRNMLEEDERVYDEPVRVRFTEFDRDAVLVKVHCFLKTTDFTESLEIGEELNFRIMDIVEGAGAAFALPSTSLFLEGDSFPGRIGTSP